MHGVLPTPSIRDKISNYNDCSCALACPAGGASAGLEFSLLLSLFQDKESKRRLHQGKKNRNYSNWLYPHSKYCFLSEKILDLTEQCYMKSKLLMRRIFLSCFVSGTVLCHSLILFAQTNPSVTHDPKKKMVQWGFTFDQDLFVKLFGLENEDRNYTMGLGIFIANNLWAERKFFSPFRSLQRKTNRFNPKDRKELERNASLSLGVTAFTPDYLGNNQIDSLYYMINDRPFACLTFLSFKYQELSKARVETNQLVIGMLGLRIARAVQTHVHERGGFGTPKLTPSGWQNQVSGPFEPTLLLSNKADMLINTGSLNSPKCLLTQFIFSREYRLGYYTEARAGIGVRFGKLDPKRWVSYDMYQMDYASHLYNKDEKLKSEIYLQALVRPYFVVYNALLNGQFRESFHTFSFCEIEHVVVEAMGGLGITLANCKKNFSTNILAYISGRTPEFKTPLSNRSHIWGGLQLSFTHLKLR
jgi:hypothetical protein